MNTNKTLIEKQIEELKRQAEAMERAEIIKKAGEYRGITPSSYGSMGQAEILPNEWTTQDVKTEINIAPSRAALKAEEKARYAKYYFNSSVIIYMDTINNPKSAYYNNSQVATIISENTSGQQIRVKINMKDVRMELTKENRLFRLSKKEDALLFVSYFVEGDFTKGIEGRWENEALTIGQLYKWENSCVSPDLFFKYQK